MNLRFASRILAVWVVVSTRGEAKAEVFRTNLPSPPGVNLVVNLSGGNVEVVAHDRPEIRVEAERNARGRAAERERKLLVETPLQIRRVGTNWSIIVPVPAAELEAPEGALPVLGGRFRFWVPRECAADLRTRLGTVEVSGLRSEVRVDVKSGGLKFEGISGPIRAETGSGTIQVTDCVGTNTVITRGGWIQVTRGAGSLHGESGGGTIQVHGFRGPLRVETAAGGIHLDHVAGAIDAVSESGSLIAELAQPIPGPVHLEATGGGGITVRVPRQAGFNLDAATASGSVGLNVGIVGPPTTPVESRVERVNGGGPELRLRTGAGSIRILPSEK